MGLSGPDLKNDLQADVKLPGVDGSLPQKKPPKFTMPNFHLPHLKKPKGEANVFADVNVPTASASVDAADVNLAKLDYKEPDLNLNGPKLSLNSPDVNAEPIDIDIDEPKIKWPHLKWKHPRGKVPEATVSSDLPSIDANLTAGAPGVDVNLPQADIKGPTLDANLPSHDLNARKINWPHLKWKRPDGDIYANLATPGSPAFKVDGDINAPDIDRRIDLDGPDVDVPSFNADVDAPSGKINWPHLRWKKKKGPKADLDIDAPNLNLQLEEPNLPKVDADLPNLNADLDAPSGKISWPHLKWKRPVINGPKSNMDLNADMDFNAELNKPEGIELGAPNAGVNIKDIEAPSSKIKWPTFKKQKRSIPGLNVKDLDPDLDVGGVRVSAPNIDGQINAPDGTIELPKLEVDAPDVDAPSGKFNLFKRPLFGTAKTPKLDLDADLDKPELALDIPDVSGPKLGGSYEGPGLNFTSPKADVDAELGKPKLPKLKLPSFKGLRSRTPEVDLKAPEIEASSSLEPDLSLSLPKVGSLDAPDPQLDLNLPKLNLEPPKIDVPTANIDRKSVV